MYDRTYWVDHVEIEGQVKVQGVLQDALHFNKQEEGTFANDEFLRWLAIMVQHQREGLNGVVPIVGEVKATNKKTYPFTDATATVSIATPRATPNYRVGVELVSLDGGFIEDVEIYDKLVNGFKIRYSGSAKSATFRYYISGGAAAV